MRVPPATHAELARDCAEAHDAHLEPKDAAAGHLERPDTKLVRAGIEEAKRLLELPVPPEQWAAHFLELWPDDGGKTLH